MLHFHHLITIQQNADLLFFVKSVRFIFVLYTITLGCVWCMIKAALLFGKHTRVQAMTNMLKM